MLIQHKVGSPILGSIHQHHLKITPSPIFLLLVVLVAVVEMPVAVELADCLQARLPQLPAQFILQQLVLVVLGGHLAHKRAAVLEVLLHLQAKHLLLVAGLAVMERAALAAPVAVVEIPHLPQAAQGHLVRETLVAQDHLPLRVGPAAAAAQVLLAVPVLGRQAALVVQGQPRP